MRDPAATRFGFADNPTSTVLMVLWLVGGMLAGWGILTYPLVKVLAVLLGSLSIVLAIWKTEAALYGIGMFLAILLEGDATPGTLLYYMERLNHPNIPSLLEVLFAVLIAAFFLRWALLHDGRYRLPGGKLPLALFFLLFLVALAYGITSGTDSTFRKEDFKRFLFPVLIFVCTVNILDSREKVLKLLRITSWAMLVKTYIADFHYIQGLGFEYGDSRVVFIESGDQTLVVTAIVAGVALLAERRMDWKSLGYLVLGLAPMLFALIFSYRRNAMWGTLFSLCLLALLSRREKKIRLLKMLAAGSACLFALMWLRPTHDGSSTGTFLKSRLTSVLDQDESSNNAHLNEWRVTYEDIMQHPILGLGLGSIHAPVPEFEEINRHTVHNALLMLWMKMGLPALLLFLWCLYRYCRLGITESLRRGDPLLTGLFASVGLWAVALNVGPSWFYYRESCSMALVMAAVCSLARLGRQSGAAPPCPGAGVAASLPLKED